jgi:hypothetical protein
MFLASDVSKILVQRTLENAIKTPFSSLNTLYVKNIGRANCFLTNTEPVENPLCHYRECSQRNQW